MTGRRSTFWCEHAWLGDTVAADVTITVEDGIISGVATAVTEPPTGAIRLAGITLPAFANAHSHAFQRAMRGRTQHGRGDFWTWRELMYAVAARLDPDSLFELARATYGEMALAGVGVVGEFHYVHHNPDGTPYDDPNAMGRALAAAAAEAGIRLTLLDTMYLHGGFDESGGYAPLTAEQRRFGDASADAWVERVSAADTDLGSPSVGVGAAIHSVRAVDPDSIRAAAEWAVAGGAPLHAHVSEQPAEHLACVDRYDRTPIGLLDDQGALGPDTTLVHATCADDADVDRAARAGAGVCLCPTTERDLADGIGDSGSFTRAGLAISLGSDSQATIDLLEEARAVELDERLATRVRGTHAPAELATMATANGYRSLGWPDGGRITVGAPADLTTIGLDSPRLAGTEPASALASVVFAGAAADVHHLVVDGEIVVRDGAHATIDVPAALANAIELVRE